MGLPDGSGELFFRRLAADNGSNVCGQKGTATPLPGANQIVPQIVPRARLPRMVQGMEVVGAGGVAGRTLRG